MLFRLNNLIRALLCILCTPLRKCVCKTFSFRNNDFDLLISLFRREPLLKACADLGFHQPSRIQEFALPLLLMEPLVIHIIRKYTYPRIRKYSRNPCLHNLGCKFLKKYPDLVLGFSISTIIIQTTSDGFALKKNHQLVV